MTTPPSGDWHNCFRSFDIKNYYDELKKTVGYETYTYKNLPSELKNRKMHTALTSNGICKRIKRSECGNVWMLAI